MPSTICKFLVLHYPRPSSQRRQFHIVRCRFSSQTRKFGHLKQSHVCLHFVHFLNLRMESLFLDLSRATAHPSILPFQNQQPVGM
jgi:hypothetical protein